MKKSQTCPACRLISEIETVPIDGRIAIVYLVDCPLVENIKLNKLPETI